MQASKIWERGVTDRGLATFSLSHYYGDGRTAATIQYALVVLLIALIVYAPLPFGSVQYSSIAILEATCALCFLLWLIRLVFCCDRMQLANFREYYAAEKAGFSQLPFFQRHHLLARICRILTLGFWPRRYIASNLVDGETPPLHPRMAYFSIFGYPVKNSGIEKVALVFLLLLFVQLIPFPVAIVRIISPETHHLYESAAAASGSKISFVTFSVDPFATLSRLLKYVAYFLLYVVVVNNIRSRRSYVALVYAILAVALFEASYGFYEFMSGQQQIFAYQKNRNLELATGTFINGNHYAAYLELAIPVLVALIIRRIEFILAFRGKFFTRIVHALESEGSKVVFLLAMLFTMVLSLTFSLSRSGICFALVSVVSFIVLYFRMQRESAAGVQWVIPIIGVLAIAIWLGSAPLMRRFMSLSETLMSESRWKVWNDTFHMFLRFPVMGTGAGTFEQIYPVYRSFASVTNYRYAHNDYLEFLTESGFFFLFVVVVFFDSMLSKLRTVASRPLSKLTILQLGAFCSLLALALHSVTEFPFQIPAIGLTATILAGLFSTYYHAERSNAS